MKIKISKYAVTPSTSTEARLLRDALDMAVDALGETEDPAVVAEIRTARAALPHRFVSIETIELSRKALAFTHLAINLSIEWGEEPDADAEQKNDVPALKALEAELGAMLADLVPGDSRAVLAEVWKHWAGGDVPAHLEVAIRRELGLPTMQGEASPS